MGKNKFFFQLLDLTSSNLYTVYVTYGGNMTFINFRERLVRDLVILPHEEWCANGSTQQFRNSNEQI
jgi:hypothetical protein